MLAVLGGLLFLLGRQLGLFGTTKHVTIPESVVGMDQAGAQTELQALGLRVQSQTQSNSASPGTVFDTSPKPGTSVKSGSTVTLLVSIGPPQVQVPDVRNQDVAAATHALQAAGFQVQTTPQNSDTVPVNVVIDQSPKPNSQAAKGSTVNLTVSAGLAQVTIPDEGGKDPTTAANDLGNLGLKTRLAFEPSDTVPQGSVTRTDPPANTPVPKGSTVTIYESTGPAQAPVPSVVGQNLPQATTTLEQAGFRVSSSQAATTIPTQDGAVISQSPNAGTQVPRGSTVIVVVGRFTPVPATAPTPASAPTTSSTTPASTTSTATPPTT
jgi:serine/threonine-protein kinase